jgi:hypothetical protein
MNLGHETQAWYDRYRKIHEVMGVQVNSEMPKMWTPLLNSGTRHYVHSPIGDRKMEKLHWKHWEKIWPNDIHTQDWRDSCCQGYWNGKQGHPGRHLYRRNMIYRNYRMYKMALDGTSWKYIRIVARNPSSVLSRIRKTELRIVVNKCTYPEYLASGMGPMGTQVKVDSSLLTWYYDKRLF